jgi:hypothetical protein
VSEEDRADYVTLFYALSSYVKFLLFVGVGPKTETEKLAKYCDVWGGLCVMWLALCVFLV